MKKGVKITLIVVPILIVVILGATLGGTLLYTKNNVSYTVGDTALTNDIAKLLLGGFSGHIETDTPLEIVNNGVYDIINLSITITITGQNFDELASLNGIVLGLGLNDLGTIPKGESWSDVLEITINENIAILAIQDGEMKISIDIVFKLNLVLFKTNVVYNEIQIEEWDSPFDF
ncbi:MAG: hypothetical protein ACTSQK_11390 [Candidatus Heimdallarchaeota archaeon]